MHGSSYQTLTFDGMDFAKSGVPLKSINLLQSRDENGKILKNPETAKFPILL